MPRRRLLGTLLAIAPVAATVACSLLVDTSDLSSSGSTANPSGEAGALDSASDAGPGSTSEAASLDGRAASYAATVLADAPIAYFRFDEPVGAKTLASAVGVFAGAYSRGVTLGAPSPVGRDAANTEAVFSQPGGLDSDLSLGRSFPFSGNQPFSVEVWMNPATVDSVSRHVVSNTDRLSTMPFHSSDGWSLVLGLDAQTGPIVWLERFSAPDVVVKAIAPIAPGVMSYVVAVYDGSALQIYVDSVARAAAVPMAAASPGSATPAFVGSVNGGVNTPHGFVGALDELAFYDKALTQAQITAHFAAGRP